MLQTQLAESEQLLLARRIGALKGSALQEVLALASRPDVLSFGLGQPGTYLFPREAYAQAVARVLSQSPGALQYGLPFEPLKTHIVRLMAQRGVACSKEEILLTTGAQQAMSLLARLLLEDDGQVLIEEMTYTGFQQVIEPFQPDILTVRTDLETGMDVEAVEALLARGMRPAFIYAVTDGHNPMGVSMSQEKRAHLVRLARQYHVPIIEDDVYGFLNYENAPELPLRVYDEQWVFYVGSFSKILAPALRVGWIVAPREVISRLAVVKEGNDLNSSTFNQYTISALLDQGLLDEHIALLRREYKARRDAMLRSLEAYFPPSARWKSPACGLFIWVELLEEIDTSRLLKVAVEEENVAFTPGLAFYTGGNRRGTNGMRLNFSNCSIEEITEGITRLARLLR
jgi:2-aminoadipate transaminase